MTVGFIRLRDLSDGQFLFGLLDLNDGRFCWVMRSE